LRRTILTFLCTVLAISVTSAKAAPSEARLALTTVLPEVNISSVPLADALDTLAGLSGANFDVDWKTLEAAGVSRQTPVSLQLHGVRLEKILRMLLSQAAGGDSLTFYIEDNVIEITTLAKADQQLVTVVYDVTDLIALDDNFDPTIPSVTVSAGGGGGGGNLPSSTGNNASSTPDMRAAKLIKIIENAVRPEIWKDNGSGAATIEYWDGKLIITAPRSVQEAIGGYLN
jgi:hypothetical protein